MDAKKLQDLHQQSSQHEQEIKQSHTCGCFYCLEIFASTEIEEWLDNGTTAICPHCGIDSVIAEKPDQLISHTLLKTMKEYYF